LTKQAQRLLQVMQESPPAPPSPFSLSPIPYLLPHNFFPPSRSQQLDVLECADMESVEQCVAQPVIRSVFATPRVGTTPWSCRRWGVTSRLLNGRQVGDACSAPAA
jgi:hypothetical protein